MKYLTLVLCAVVMLSGSIISAQSNSASIPGSTIAIVNLRSGPGTGFDVVEIVPADTPVVFVGRNASSTWLLARVGQVEGWLSYTYVNVEGRVGDLPVGNRTTTAPSTETTPSDSQNSVPAPSVDWSAGVVPVISETTREIFNRGRSMGNKPDVFSKVGDSITASSLYLDPIGNGGLQLNDYAYLEPVVQYFSQTPARDHFSFANTSLAARNGWTTRDVLDPGKSSPGVCLRNETPLECEYRSVQPAFALIMLGTNDATVLSISEYENNMNLIVQVTIDRGIVPVLSTIPAQYTQSGDRVQEINQVIREIAAAYDIPLWDYWRAMQGLPNQGISTDNVHPSYDYSTNATAIFTAETLRYGYNMRNLTALMVLDTLWRGLM